MGISPALPYFGYHKATDTAVVDWDFGDNNADQVSRARNARAPRPAPRLTPPLGWFRVCPTTARGPDDIALSASNTAAPADEGDLELGGFAGLNQMRNACEQPISLAQQIQIDDDVC